MKAYKTSLTIKDPKRVVLSDLPFQTGQRVEVVFLAEEEPTASHIQDFQALLKTTQALPQGQLVSEEEIAAEIAAYRAGQ